MNTQEKIRVMSAFAQGEKIEFITKHESDSEWLQINEPNWNWMDYDYRIKPKPKYQPFNNREECINEMKKHVPFGWIKNDISNKTIIEVEKQGIYYSTNCFSSFDDAFTEFNFDDDTPFGKQV